MVTLSSYLISQIITFILPPNVYGWYTLEQRFAKWTCDRLTENADFGKKKTKKISDEAHFDLGGYVNKKNCSIWDTENPHAYIEKPTHQNELLFGVDFEA